MKKSFIVWFLAAGLLVISAPARGAVKNFIKNGGFEQIGHNNIPAGWNLIADRGTKFDATFDTTEKHSGTYSYKIIIDPPGGRVTLYPKPKSLLPISPGKTYEMSFWIKVKNLDYNSFFLAPVARLNFKPQRFDVLPTIDLMEKLKGNSEWTNLTLRATAPKNAKHLVVDFILTKGTIWLDDIVIRKIK